MDFRTIPEVIGLYSLSERSYQSRETKVKLCQLEGQSGKSWNYGYCDDQTDFFGCHSCKERTLRLTRNFNRHRCLRAENLPQSPTCETTLASVGNVSDL
jgi:hypothetical protein